MAALREKGPDNKVCPLVQKNQKEKKIRFYEFAPPSYLLQLKGSLQEQHK